MMELLSILMNLLGKKEINETNQQQNTPQSNPLKTDGSACSCWLAGFLIAQVENIIPKTFCREKGHFFLG